MVTLPTAYDSSVGGGIMPATNSTFELTHNPLDRLERLAENRRWALDRTSDEEVVMLVAGGWCDLTVSLTWRDDLESLLVASAYELKVPGKRREEVERLLMMINIRLLHGHFDFWDVDGMIIFRHALLLAGGAEANDAQCEGLVKVALEACQKFYPAIQFVIWAGHSAEQAMNSALLETKGEA
jgi:hypothetical protein